MALPVVQEGLVEALKRWADENEDQINGKLVRAFPRPEDYQHKASINILYGPWVMTFTVWDESSLMGDALVVDPSSGKVRLMKERVFGTADEMYELLHEAVAALKEAIGTEETRN